MGLQPLVSSEIIEKTHLVSLLQHLIEEGPEKMVRLGFLEQIFQKQKDLMQMVLMKRMMKKMRTMRMKMKKRMAAVVVLAFLTW
jgi:hypothetical protein